MQHFASLIPKAPNRNSACRHSLCIAWHWEVQEAPLCISSIEWLFSRASNRAKKQSHRNKGRTHAWHHRKYMTTSLRWQSSYALVVSKSSFRMFPCSFPSARAVGIVYHMITWYPLQKKQWPNGNPTAFLAQEKWEPFCECLTKCGHFLQQMEEFRMIGRRKLWREQQEMQYQWRSLLYALVNHFGFPTLIPWVKRAESTENNLKFAATIKLCWVMLHAKGANS